MTTLFTLAILIRLSVWNRPSSERPGSSTAKVSSPSETPLGVGNQAAPAGMSICGPFGAPPSTSDASYANRRALMRGDTPACS